MLTKINALLASSEMLAKTIQPLKIYDVINLHCNQCKTGLSNPWNLFKIPVKSPLLAYKSSPGIPSALLGDVLYKCKQLLNTPQVFLPLKTRITAIIVAFFCDNCWPLPVLTFFSLFCKASWQRSNCYLKLLLALQRFHDWTGDIHCTIINAYSTL